MSCPGCQKAFKTEAALYSHQRQTKKTRCRHFYASGSHGSQLLDSDHISDVDMMEDFGYDSSSEARIPTEPQGDYFGNYDDYDHAHSTSPPLSPFPSSINVDPTLRCTTTVDSDSDTDDLEFATTALECEGGWEPNPDNVDQHHLSRSLSSSPVLLFTPSPLPSQSVSLQSSRSSSPSMVISEADDEAMPVFANLTPYRRLFYNNPFIVHFPNPLAGAPVSVDDVNYQQSMNEVYQHQLGKTHNVYTPFSSGVDWEVVRWAKLRGPTSTAFSDLLNIPGVCEILSCCSKGCADKVASNRLLKNLACRTLTHGNSMKLLIRSYLVGQCSNVVKSLLMISHTMSIFEISWHAFVHFLET